MAEAKTAANRGEYSHAISILKNIQITLAETASARAGDRLFAVLDAELKEMQARMWSRHVYETSGRAVCTAAMRSHSTQRATTVPFGAFAQTSSFIGASGGTASGCASPGASAQGFFSSVYQTPSMASMVNQSQKMSGNTKAPTTTLSSGTSTSIFGLNSSASINQP